MRICRWGMPMPRLSLCTVRCPNVQCGKWQKSASLRNDQLFMIIGFEHIQITIDYIMLEKCTLACTGRMRQTLMLNLMLLCWLNCTKAQGSLVGRLSLSHYQWLLSKIRLCGEELVTCTDHWARINLGMISQNIHVNYVEGKCSCFSNCLEGLGCPWLM